MVNRRMRCHNRATIGQRSKPAESMYQNMHSLTRRADGTILLQTQQGHRLICGKSPMNKGLSLTG